MRSGTICGVARKPGTLLFVVLFPAMPAVAGPDRPGSVPLAEEASATPAAVSLGWPDIVRLVDEHPSLAAARFQVDAARGGLVIAGAVPNPTLEGNIGRGFARNGDASRVEWDLALSVPLDWLAQRGAHMEAARAEVDAAQADAESLRREVLLRLRTLFWNLAFEQARVVAIEELQAQTAALAETVKRRVEKGEVRPGEAIRVEIELEKAAGELEAARTTLEARRAELALWLGVPEGTKLGVVADLDVLPETMDRETALSRARIAHPALAAARARAHSLEARLDSEKMARLPAIGITGFTSYELDRRAYGVGLTVDLPLWNWNSGGIAQAEARLAAARQQAEAAGRELLASLLDAQAACQAAVAGAARLREKVLPLAERAAATTEKTYRLGEASLLEVIDARRTLLESRRLCLSALSQAQIECGRLGALLGKE